MTRMFSMILLTFAAALVSGCADTAPETSSSELNPTAATRERMLVDSSRKEHEYYWYIIFGNGGYGELECKGRMAAHQSMTSEADLHAAPWSEVSMHLIPKDNKDVLSSICRPQIGKTDDAFLNVPWLTVVNVDERVEDNLAFYHVLKDDTIAYTSGDFVFSKQKLSEEEIKLVIARFFTEEGQQRISLK